MGNRLSRIYTRTGDGGTTGLADGSRVAKDCARIEALGAIDELNSQLGAVLAQRLPAAVREPLTIAQHRLFDLGAELAIPGATRLADADVNEVEEALDALNESLPPLKEFILPGGGAAACAAHLARSVCRRAERRLLSLEREEALNEVGRRYLNRLSDLLFVIARVAARADQGEVYWRPLTAPTKE